jgi:zinc transporter ZupT
MTLTHPAVAAALLAIAVIAGGGLVNLIRDNRKAALNAMLVFSGAFLLGVSALHLIPEVYELAPHAGLFLLVGFLVQILAESLSKGVEHGHHHVHGKAFPISILIGLFLHTYIEAVPMSGLDDPSSTEAAQIHHHHHHNHSHTETVEPASEEPASDDDLAKSFLLGVVAHKIPMAFALMALMMQAGVTARKRWVWLFVFAMSGPLGVLTGNMISDTDAIYALLAVALGSFLHVSTTIILESESSHRISLRHLSYVLSGFGLAWLLTNAL